MPNKTGKLNLNTWLENEQVNFEEINENFEKIDKLIICTESGTKTAAYSGGSDSMATWRYKKYSDGTVEMSTKLSFNTLKCNGGDAAPYISTNSKLFFPFSFSEIYDVQMHLVSEMNGWVSDITSNSVVDYREFRIVGMKQETDNTAKQIYVTVKGVL